MAVALVVALVSPGCVEPARPGVGLRAVAADIAFGLAEEDAPAPMVLPPNTLPAFPPLDLGDLTPPSASPIPPFVLPEIPPELRPCQPLGPDAFPDEPATLNVPEGARPEEGIYRWRILGSAEIPGLPIRLAGGGTELRAVRNVQEQLDGVFTFETLQLNLLPPFGIVETTWRVKTQNLGTVPVEAPIVPSEPPSELPIEVPTEIPTAVPPFPDIPTETVVVLGEPDRGIAISRIRYLDAQLQEVARFEPAVPLLILPLPVRVAERVSSTAVDLVTLQTMTFQGQVEPAERVEACTEVVEGWRVAGTLQVGGGASTSSSDREWVFMPQFGGALARESVHQTTTVETDAGPVPAVIDLDSTLAQIQPLPLPEELR